MIPDDEAAGALVALDRADGGILGEHYIMVAGKCVGVAQPAMYREIHPAAPCPSGPSGPWAVRFYPGRWVSPTDLLAIARAVEQKEQEAP